MIVTIDGPSASGKSSVACALAGKLNGYCLSSGALYRALGYVLVTYYDYTLSRLSSPALSDVQEIIQTLVCIPVGVQRCGRIHFKDIDIVSFLKSEQVDTYASIIATVPAVREQLSTLQRSLACQTTTSVVVEGRDAGSVVFPDATWKFFLTASIAVRAQRWQQDQEKKHNFLSREQAAVILQERDERDSKRVVAPLKVPHDAYCIDSSFLTLEETVEIMIKVVQKAL